MYYQLSSTLLILHQYNHIFKKVALVAFHSKLLRLLDINSKTDFQNDSSPKAEYISPDSLKLSLIMNITLGQMTGLILHCHYLSH